MTFRLCRLGLNLDDARASMGDLEILSPASGRTPRRMVRLFLTLVTRQALSDGAVALSMFDDGDDDSLPILEYLRKMEDQQFEYYEMLPAPGCFAKDVFRELRRMTGLRRFPGQRRCGFGAPAASTPPPARRRRRPISGSILRTTGRRSV